MENVNAFAALPDDAYAGAADVLRALSHPVRLRIVAGLLDGTCCVGPMTSCLDLPQPLVSRHLAVLRDAGIVDAKAVGRERYYTVVHPLAAPLIALVLGEDPQAAKPRTVRPAS